VLGDFGKVLDLVIIKAFELYLNLVEGLLSNNTRSFTSKLPRATICVLFKPSTSYRLRDFDTTSSCLLCPPGVLD
jgi:hypothetical protein